MLELWFVFGVLCYICYAISTSIDKYMMNHRYDVLKTDTFKMFFDGVILLILGVLFFRLQFTFQIVVLAVGLGVFKAITSIIYYNALKLKDAEEFIPFHESGTILLVFVFSVIAFNEIVTTNNYFGVLLILIGIYAVLSRDGFRLPRVDKGLAVMVLGIIAGSIYILLAKRFLVVVDPIHLAILMYFSATIILMLYHYLFRRKTFRSLFAHDKRLKTIGFAALFGGVGTFFLYSALAIGNASKVYPLAGLQSVFIFILASFFLKEKFTWHRLIGTILVFAGVYFVAI